ncbi:Hypothetical protein NTJ_03524 [Nesidiocoris tenuis]|uniref:Secreted protein n=1 Tax=Nesidiocoris tenuis TaxID=355587 RepID=A0ABN7AEL0_9HEMI|nr:Hypothetical protein NTJ_03524 [Nesidiocoris tenuis]
MPRCLVLPIAWSIFSYQVHHHVHQGKLACAQRAVTKPFPKSPPGCPYMRDAMLKMGVSSIGAQMSTYQPERLVAEEYCNLRTPVEHPDASWTCAHKQNVRSPFRVLVFLLSEPPVQLIQIHALL